MKVNSLTFDIPQPNNPTGRSGDPHPSQDSQPPAQSSPPAAAEKIIALRKPIVNGVGLGLEFAVDQSTGRNVIRVYDVETGKIVRQIPPEEVLNFLREFESLNGPVLSRML